MGDYMQSVFKLLDARRSGHINSSLFLLKASRKVFGEYTDKHGLTLNSVPPSVEDTSVVMNRLMILNDEKMVYAYDIGYVEDNGYGLVATWDSGIRRNLWRSNGCVRWGLETSVASVSGHANKLYVLDTRVFELVKAFDINDVDNIFVHAHNPFTVGLVAIGSDSPWVPIIDLRIPSTSYVQMRTSKEPVRCIEWSPFRQHQFISGSGNELFLWDLRSPISIKLCNIDLEYRFHQKALYLDADHVIALLQPNLIQILDISKGEVQVEASIEHLLTQSVYKPFKFFVNLFSKPKIMYVPTCNYVTVVELEPPFRVIDALPTFINIRLVEFNCGTNELFAFSDSSAELFCPKYYWQ